MEETIKTILIEISEVWNDGCQ